MLLVAAVVLVLLVGAAVVVAAAGMASSRGDSEGAGWGAAAVVPAVAAGLVVLLVVAVFGLGGLRSSVDVHEADEAVEAADEVEPVEAADEVEPVEAADDEPVALTGAPATYDGLVSVDAGASPLRPMPVVTGLADGDVVEVRANGFLGNAEGAIAQCERTDAHVCRNVAPILTDGDGRVLLPYRIEGVTTGEVLVIEVDFARGVAALEFGAASPERADLSVRDGAAAIKDARPGDRVAVRRCDAEVAAVSECETLGRATVGADGTASLPIGVVGGESMLVLTGLDDRVLAEPVQVRVASAIRAEVDVAPQQLLVGFTLALLLLGIAVFLIRTTDWRVPAEAATPFLDAAPLEA